MSYNPNTGGASAWGGITGTLSAQTDLQSALDAKQPTLASGTNIKTVNGNSLVGSGNVSISASISQTTIDFGTTPINEKTFTITDATCTATSKIILFVAGVGQANTNYGIQLNLAYIPAIGTFQITANSGNENVIGTFIINYIIS